MGCRWRPRTLIPLRPPARSHPVGLNFSNVKTDFLFRPNVPGRAVAPAPQTAAGSLLATTTRGQSSSPGDPRPCCHGDLRAWRTGLGTLRRSISSSGELQLERPGSAHTPSGARWACPEEATPLARGHSAAGRWCRGNGATTHRLAWNHKKKK